MFCVLCVFLLNVVAVLCVYFVHFIKKYYFFPYPTKNKKTYQLNQLKNHTQLKIIVGYGW